MKALPGCKDDWRAENGKRVRLDAFSWTPHRPDAAAANWLAVRRDHAAGSVSATAPSETLCFSNPPLTDPNYLWSEHFSRISRWDTNIKKRSIKKPLAVKTVTLLTLLNVHVWTLTTDAGQFIVLSRLCWKPLALQSVSQMSPHPSEWDWNGLFDALWFWLAHAESASQSRTIRLHPHAIILKHHQSSASFSPSVETSVDVERHRGVFLKKHNDFY